MPKKKSTKPINRVNDLIQVCKVLGFVKSESSKSVSVDIPHFKDFKLMIPETGAVEQIKLYHTLFPLFEEHLNFCSPDLGKQNRSFYVGVWNLAYTGVCKKTLTFSPPQPKKRKLPRTKNKGSEDAMFRRVPGSFGSNH